MLTVRSRFSIYRGCLSADQNRQQAFGDRRTGLRCWSILIHQSRETESMGLIRKLKHQIRFAAARGYALLPVQGVSKPVFVLGCGRSGTTIFGTALSKHRSITYLNEPRHLWFAAYPETDIWSDRAAKRHGTLTLTADDADQQKSEKLRRLFRFETIVANRPLLVEKLPINSFRLPFIHEIFPDARFIHIHRNALEVARSIASQCDSGLWFASHDYKWNELVRYAQARGETSSLPAICSNYFQMGLLEWRLSTEAAVTFFAICPRSDIMNSLMSNSSRPLSALCNRSFRFSKLATTRPPKNSLDTKSDERAAQ